MIGNYGGVPSGTGGEPGERRPGDDASQDVKENIVKGSTKPGELSDKDDLVELYHESIAYSPDSIKKFLKSDDNKEVVFTLYNLLHVGLTPKEQESVDRSKDKNEPVDDRIAKRMTEGLIKAINRNGLMDEVLRDPFLRERHIEYLIRGELESNSPIEERQNEIAEFLWSLDGGFYESKGVRGLISDERGERRNLFLLRVLNQGYGRDNVWRASSKDEKEKIAEQYGALMSTLIEGGVTLRQLVKDPFLRKEHFDKLLELETGEGEYSEAKAKLWSFDEGFTESEDYYKMMEKRISEHPEIYEHPDKTEIDRLTDSVVQGISADKVMNVMANYRENMRSGDEELRRILLEAVGFRDKNNLPEIEYSKLRGGEEGRYDWRNNKIIIDEDGIRNGLVRSSISFVDEEDLLGNNNPKINDNDELIHRRIGVVAQEIWHACEWRGNLVDDERGRLYKENFVYYVDARDNQLPSYLYRSQLIEAEAWTFAEKVVALIQRRDSEARFAAKAMDLIHGAPEE